MQVKREQAQSLKQELEEGLERWRQQVGSIVTIISLTLYVTQKIIINMQMSRQGSHYSPWSIKPAIMYPLLVCLVASSKYFYRIL